MKLSEFESFEDCPYMYEGFVLKHRRARGATDRDISFQDTGEIAKVVYTDSEFVPHDDLRFVKVFHNSINQLRDFSVSGIKSLVLHTPSY